jgi:hypothetical protein
MMNSGSKFYDEGQLGFEFQGKTYLANGAQVDERFCIGYLGAGGKLLSCGGAELGRYRIRSTWRMPRSCFISSYQHQVVATVDGRTYTGRSFGSHMIFKGRRVARELKSAGRNDLG